MPSQALSDASPPAPRVRLSLGVTGHRSTNPHYWENCEAIAQTVGEIFDRLDSAVAAEVLSPGLSAPASTRLHSMLVDGFDQLTAQMALSRGWDLVAPLPFGQALNVAVNAAPVSLEEANSLLLGEGPCSQETRNRAEAIIALQARARLFELSDLDETLSPLFLATLAAPQSLAAAQAYGAPASAQVALAARVMIEQSDIIIAVWDGATSSQIGGAGQTIALALELGAPVVWIDARAPDRWRILRTPESLVGLKAKLAVDPARYEILNLLASEALQPTPGKKALGHSHRATSKATTHAEGLTALKYETWRSNSAVIWHGYRRIEALFGGEDLRAKFRNLTQIYESPDAIGRGSAAKPLAAAAALPGQEAAFLDRLSNEISRRFAWADGISARLSDTYRGGMILNFIFSALAIIGGLAYLPFAGHDDKWAFALAELILLLSILSITFVGQKLNWHRRWFETRRVAEYLRHAPILLLLGVARPAGRWPRGSETSWPEWYVRHALRDVGLPQIRLTPAYLHGALGSLLAVHIVAQRDYHQAKAARLARAHHQLDRLSSALFGLAVLAVLTYLTLRAAGAVHLIDLDIPRRLTNLFTFLGVALPTLGGAIAGIRYFGDFERFSAISEVTSQKLAALAVRANILLDAPIEALTYAKVSELVHAADDIVVDEIENWQAVFGGKHVTVPV